MAGVLAIGLWFQSTRPTAEEEEPPRALVEGGKTGAPSPIEVSPTDQPPEADTGPMNRQAEEAIERLVQDWAAAWESRESNEVLSHYAADFEPAGYRLGIANPSAQLHVEVRICSYRLND